MTKVRKDKIYYNLLKDDIRNQILDRIITVKECFSKDMYNFLLLLKQAGGNYKDTTVY